MFSDSDDDFSFSSIHTNVFSTSLQLREKRASAKNNLYKMQLQRYEIYKAQIHEDGNFDLTLEFGDGKKLYVHKFHITSVSETLDVMLSSRWSTNDKVVKVEDYSYDDFFIFVSFLYSGKCDLTNENILRITDMAEYYDVSTLKNYCDLFLS
uniref:BTB domain-containing protein n=1 Tax=Panagrolaimus sp. PS1159 TaxID=55785 RepID=A0AC35FFZ2_9BILA